MNTLKKSLLTASIFIKSMISILLPSNAQAADTSATAQLQQWSVQAGTPGNAVKGQAFFNTKHGNDLSCASCHGTPPIKDGKHVSTGKLIPPLAPAFNTKSFTDTATVEKWFRRNCKDVLSRECSPSEKADVLAYLINLK